MYKMRLRVNEWLKNTEFVDDDLVCSCFLKNINVHFAEIPGSLFADFASDHSSASVDSP